MQSLTLKKNVLGRFRATGGLTNGLTNAHLLNNLDFLVFLFINTSSKSPRRTVLASPFFNFFLFFCFFLLSSLLLLLLFPSFFSFLISGDYGNKAGRGAGSIVPADISCKYSSFAQLNETFAVINVTKKRSSIPKWSGSGHFVYRYRIASI